MNDDYDNFNPSASPLQRAGSACERSAAIHAYHDGELDAARVRALEAHLSDCDSCADLLAELQGLTAMLSAAPVGLMPDRAISRFHGAWHVARDRGVLRITGWLTAAAAALLVGALLTNKPQPTATPVRSGIWEAMAVMPPAETQSETNADLVQVAQWMADDLSYSGGPGGITAERR